LPFTTTIAIGLSAGRGVAANGTSQTLTLALSRAGAPGVIVEVPALVAVFRLRFPVS
jgi:hypothetical protein